MQRVTVLTSLVLAGLAVPPLGAAEKEAKPETLNVWPGSPPGEKGKIDKEKVTHSKPDERRLTLITNVTQPTLTVYRPARDKDTGAAVVIAPGGGYFVLAWDLEGEEVAHWLNRIGVTAVVLKYRVPRRSGTPGDKAPPQAAMDAQRAISLVRSKAKEWGIDPKRIGMLGFSAGGHLTAWTATNFDRRAYEVIDDVDRVSCRPDFAVLVYPAYLVGNDRSKLRPDIRVTKESPQCFFVHAEDDKGVPCENSIMMFLALKNAGVHAALHVYVSGGHGFGLRPSEHPASHWPERCAEWMKSRGFLTATR